MNPNISVPGNEEIREILVKRVDQQKQAVGIVVGVIEPAGRRVIAYGNLAKGDPRKLDGDTIFEIGSVTKVFTSLLLADMVSRNEVALYDPAANIFPKVSRCLSEAANPSRCSIFPRTLPGSRRFPETRSWVLTPFMP